MAITAFAQGTWSIVTADAAVTIPGSPDANCRMFVYAVWKAFDTTAQITSPVAWTEITEFADGSVAPGANVGSVKVGAWYRDWQSGDTAPTVDFSAAPVPGAVVMVIFQKGAGETWDSPAFATAAIPAATDYAAVASSDPGITAGDLVLCLTGCRDDSSTWTHTTASLAISCSGITAWQSNAVEYPTTHASTTTSNDIAAEGLYRIAVTGTSSAPPQSTGQFAASETGAALFIRQRVSAAGTSANAEAATGTGAANGTGKSVSTSSGLGSGSGAAAQATIQTGKNVDAIAATGIGAAGTFGDYADVVIGTSPIGYWRLGEPSSGTIEDASGNGYDGTISGGTHGSPGALVGDLNTAISFDASTDLDIGRADGGLHPATITIAAWAKRSSTGVAFIWDNGSGDAELFYGFDDRLRWSRSGIGSWFTSTDAVTDTDWHQIVAVKDTNVIAVYFDGAPMAGITDFGPGAPADAGGGSQIGATLSATNDFIGSLDEVAVWNRALSATEVVALWLAGHTGHIEIVTNGGSATGTGVAGLASANIAPNAGHAPGTGLAIGTRIDVGTTAQHASGTGAAHNATANVPTNADHAAGTGQAFDATVSTAVNTNVDAGHASGMGAAADVTPSVAVGVIAATGTGAAHTPLPSLGVNAQQATGTGAAFDATVSTASNVTANAVTATGTGAVQVAAINVGASPTAATGTGSAFSPGISTTDQAPAETADGTGQAFDATVSTASMTNVNAGHASGTGEAFTLSASIGQSASTATGTGQAGQASANISGPAGQAVGTGAAGAPAPGVGPVPAAATGIGEVLESTRLVAVNVEAATGTGAAYDVSSNLAPPLPKGVHVSSIVIPPEHSVSIEVPGRRVSVAVGSHSAEVD